MAPAVKLLEEPVPGRLTIGYAPDGERALTENPPRFTWLPVLDREAVYALRLSQDPEFAPASTLVFRGLDCNFHTPDRVLEPGPWYWSYAVWQPDEDLPSTGWSQVRRFTISGTEQHTPLPDRAARLTLCGTAHPRLWLDGERLKAFGAAVRADPAHCGWDVFLAKSVMPWLDAPVMPEPAGYPGHQRTAEVWRRVYIECQELLYAIRHLSIGAAVTGDAAMQRAAKAWLLAAASWDPEGPTSRSYSDEWAFRVNLALAWGYDWLHDALDEAERTLVRDALIARTRQTAHHVMHHAHIGLFPYDSHAVRAVSAVMVPASIALLHECDEARAWLDYSVEFLFTVYSPWGDDEGGWAEGAHYWMTGMAYLIDAANLLKSYTGLDLYQRPFFHNTADFPFFTRAPSTRRATFGDDATLGDPICIKMAYNVRQFAGVTRKPHLQWYFETVRKADPGTQDLFYNWGWWDLSFDDLVYRHDFEAVEAAAPDDDDRFRWFKGIGWVCIQKAPHEPARHIQFNFKSSRYGSISHSHADQNAFCLSAYGEDLAIQSGHYVAFNTSMHLDWRRQTRSKNAVLIDGQGQYCGGDKAQAIRANGFIIDARDHGDHIFMAGDATAAYSAVNPAITKVVREVRFVHDSYFVITDLVEADKAVSLEWLVHANGPFETGRDLFRRDGERAGFYGQVLWSQAGSPDLVQQTGFPGVDEADHEGLAVSTCLIARYPKARQHRIATLLVPYALDAPRRIFSFLDDQGFAANLYFTDSDDRSFKVSIAKSLAPAGR